MIIRLTLLIWLSPYLAAQADDWPQWRGPTGNNHAAAGATAPTEWGEDSHIVWRTPVPGRGCSSPTIYGKRIYLTTSDEEVGSQSLLVFDRATGRLLKETVAHWGNLPPKIHPKNTHASPTVACDGRRVYALFNNDYATKVTAFDLEGAKLWQEKVSDFDPQEYEFGYGASPILVDGVLVVAADYDGADSGIYAIDPANGRQVWHTPRPEKLSFSSPIATDLDGRVQLIISGLEQIASYDPATGRVLWSTEASTQATCGTMVWDNNLGLAFASGGYPDSFTLAIRTNGDHQVVWQEKVKCYEQSLLSYKGYVYAASDNGVAYCLRAKDGKEMWKKRLSGPFSSSPLLVGETIYVTNEMGTTYVFKATPDDYQAIAENELGDEAFATPAACDGRLYHRYATRADGPRQEYLVAIGGESGQ